MNPPNPPHPINVKDPYDEAKKRSELRGYKWEYVYPSNSAPNGQTLIRVPQNPNYVIDGPGSSQNYLWQQAADYSHLHLEFVGSSYRFQMAHLTLGAGQFLRVNKFFVRHDLGGNKFAACTRETLIADLLGDEGLARKVRSILRNADFNPDRKKEFEAKVARLVGQDVVWQKGAEQALTAACAQALEELSAILGDFGLGDNAPIPYVPPP